MAETAEKKTRRAIVLRAVGEEFTVPIRGPENVRVRLRAPTIQEARVMQRAADEAQGKSDLDIDPAFFSCLVAVEIDGVDGLVDTIPGSELETIAANGIFSFVSEAIFLECLRRVGVEEAGN